MKKRPDWLHSPEVQVLAKAFSSHQNELRFVGGCVRDSILDRLVTDIDLATSLAPEAVMQIGEAAGIRMIPTGIKHGTVTAAIAGRQLEITTLRRDTACDGRHAKVAFTDSWEEDAARRDFTMNALYLSFDGELTDYTGGREDAKAGRVRFIGDANARISEDYLRILRFFRFFAHYGKEPADKEAVAACKEGKDGLRQLSGERIQQEMLKLLAAENPVPALTLMEQTGVLAVLMETVNVSRLETILALEKQTGVKALPATRLTSLLDTNEIKTVAERWKLSGALQRDLAALHENLEQIKISLSEAEQKRLLRQLKRETFEQLALLAWANDRKNDYASFLKLAKNWSIPEFPLSGEDLLQQGFASGKEMGDMLRALEQKWEESDYSLSKAALLKSATKK